MKRHLKDAANLLQSGSNEAVTAAEPGGVRASNYERLFRNVLDGVYQTTPDGKLLAANPALLRMLGYESEDELREVNLGADVYDDPQMRQRWVMDLELHGEVRNTEVVLRRKDGQRIVVLDNARAVRDENGRVLHYEGTLTDITDLKQAEQVQSVLLQIAEAVATTSTLPDLITIIHRELARLIDTRNFYVALYDEGTGLYSFPYHVDEYEETESLDEQDMSKSLTDYVRRTGRPLLVDEEEHRKLIASQEVELVGKPSPIWLGVPLRAANSVIGVVAVQSYSESTAYSQRDLDLITFVSGSIALAIERKRTEQALQESERRFRQLAENIHEMFWITTADGREIVYVSPAYEQIWGRSRKRLFERPLDRLDAVSPEDRDRVRRVFSPDSLRNGFDEEYRVIRPDGSIRWIRDRGFPVRDGGGRIYRVAGIAEDITERKEYETRLEYLARFDALTDLPNRFLFEDRIRQAVRRARRAGERVALLYLDLDDFKNVNDTLGHPTGDELLRAVAARLTLIVRDSDTVARLGGDEFAIIQTGIGNPAGVTALACRVLESVAKPFRLGGEEIHVTTSIGISVSSSDDDPAELVSQADRALYRAKDEGRNTFQFHSRELAEQVHTYVTLRRDLHGALERREFFLDYQPQIDLASGRIVGCEALVRWRHPQNGLVSPGAFIPVAENTGLIIPLGEWVLREACRQRRVWCDAGLPEVSVAVNLSAVQFRRPGFTDQVLAVLRETDLPSELLELELTESILMRGSEAVRQTLAASRKRGIRFAIDDFGTGYSSLKYLREFPVQKLKIAMDFVQGVTVDPDDAAIVDAVISLGHKLGIKVLAEGVETAEQRDFLRERGCDEAQGYFFSKPLSPADFAARLAGDGGGQH